MKQRKQPRAPGGRAFQHQLQLGSETMDRDFIRVSHTEALRVPVREVIVRAELADQDFIVGPEGFESAPDIIALRRDLSALGFDEAALEPTEVAFTSRDGGLFSNASTETCFRLNLRCPVEQFERLLEALEKRDKLMLTELEWGFGDLDEIRAALIERCLRATRAEAARRADILGVPLLGVHRLSVETETSDRPGLPGGSPHKMSRKRAADVLVGSWGTHQTLQARALGEFLVGPFLDPAGHGHSGPGLN